MGRLATLLTLILVVAACRASAAEHKLFAWRVADDPGTVYLLGSIHVGKPDLYPLPQPIEQAFAGSAELVEEIDMSGANLALLRQQILQRGLYTAATSSRTICRRRPGRRSRPICGAPGKRPRRCRRCGRGSPTCRSTPLNCRRSASPRNTPSTGISSTRPQPRKSRSRVWRRSVSRSIWCPGCRTICRTSWCFFELVDAYNLAGDAAALVQAWRTGDTAGMEATATLAEREHPELQPLIEALVYQRNAAMARQVEGFLKTPKTLFVVVGALHLVGDRGILKLLADKGYRIEQLRVQ